MDVKPWEPVTLKFKDMNTSWVGHSWDWELDQCWDDMTTDSIREWSSQGLKGYVTLANGQRIIVRALSEDRKAARAAMKEANR